MLRPQNGQRNENKLRHTFVVKSRLASTAPTQKGFLLSATNLGIYLKINIPIFSFFGINLFTNWVITNFGSNFLEISHDFADFWGKTGKFPGKYPKGSPI